MAAPLEDLSNYQTLCQEDGICGGRVTIKGTRMEPRYVVSYLELHGIKNFKDIWPHISELAVVESFIYDKKRK